jgi:heme a synthase
MFVNTDPYIKAIRLWLITLFIFIITIICVGGLTRLTESGLSITEWELFTGILPPLNPEKWNFYFNQYQKTTEFKQINYNMTVDEFKIIFYWEYAHRLLARFIGIIAIIPLLFISYKHKNTFFYNKKYFIIFGLISLQGLIGWLMVISGLVENTDVSHYRLALHLFIALTILSLVFWFILENLNIIKFKNKLNDNFLKIFFFLIIIQIIFGVFLAGLNGGLLYNSWPDMNGSFFPDDIVRKDLYNSDFSSDPSVVQFYHRIIAYIIIIFLIILNYFFFVLKIQSKPIIIFNFAILFQIFIGILTLITGVKIYYASLHQLGSVFVLSSFLFIYYKNIS